MLDGQLKSCLSFTIKGIISKARNQIEEPSLPVTVGGGEQDSVFSIAGGQPGTVGGDLLWAGGWWRVEVVAWL